ncbi:DUF4180 domain-containing protein [Paludibacter sp. 221]|nr:DUF4180 domain-containing protein [Paludibacter sp. 221]
MQISGEALRGKIKSQADVMGFFGDCYGQNCIGMIIDKEVFDDSFFDLKTGLAGEILQKFATYRMKLAIVGDFSEVASKSLRDFIRESNRQKFINFVESVEKAIEIFGA